MLLSKHSKKILDGIIQHKNLANSYIFCGPEESCISENALIFAKSVLESLSNLNKPIKEENNPDLILLIPEKKQLSIEEIKNLQKKIKFGPTQYKKRIVIIHNSHTMTNSAANAFLKTLEEPPQDTHFILLCNTLFSLLPTIRSRSQIISLQSSSTETITSILTKLKKEPIKIEKELEHYTHFLPYILNNKFEDIKKIIHPYNTLLKMTPHQKIEFASLISKDKDITEKCCLGWMKDILIQNKKITKTQQHHLELLIENISQIKYNLNLRLHIETLLLKLQKN